MMTTIHLYVFLSLVSNSPYIVCSLQKQRNELVDFIQTDKEPSERNQLVLNLNGNAHTITNRLYVYIEDNGTEVNNTVGNNNTMDHSKSSENQVQSFYFRSPYNNNTATSIPHSKNTKYKNKASTRRNRLKKKCNKRKIKGVNKIICFSYRKLRVYNIPRWFIEFTSLFSEKFKPSSSQNKTTGPDNTSVRKTKSSRYDKTKNFQLKRRCCRYHFKYYFKYFPVLQPYVYKLLESIEDLSILSFILDAGFIMSCSALICIFLSMTISRKLREEKGNIVLLHFCFSIFIQIILHFVICDFTLNILFAEVASNIFQYFTLVEFAWTSVIAFIQYRRYVTVFASDQNCSVLRLSLIVYISSAVPIVARVIWDHDHSIFMTYLTFSVPQLVTLIINLVILLLISRNIMCTKVWSPYQKRSISMEAKVIFMLFLILDLGWIVAMLALLTSNIVFAYIFIFSQSLQGFALFFIFIIMNRQNRKILKNIWTTHTTKKGGIESFCGKKPVEKEKTVPVV